MMARFTIQKALLFGTALAMVGCGNGPVATSPEVAAPQAPQADRQVLSVTADSNLESLISQLPQRLTEEEASRLLVSIDPSQVSEAKSGTYSVLRRGSGGRGSYGGGHRGSYGGWRGSYGGRGRWGGYGRYRYYGYGGYYWPYASYGGYYYPYFASGYYPYLYGYGGVYNPYVYYNPLFSYTNPFLASTGLATGYSWPGVGAMAARQAAGQAIGQSVGQAVGQQLTDQTVTQQSTATPTTSVDTMVTTQ